MEEKRSAYTFLVGKPKGKKPLGRHSINVQCWRSVACWWKL